LATLGDPAFLAGKLEKPSEDWKKQWRQSSLPRLTERYVANGYNGPHRIREPEAQGSLEFSIFQVLYWRVPCLEVVAKVQQPVKAGPTVQHKR
jgi:hypothetical protein